MRSGTAGRIQGGAGDLLDRGYWSLGMPGEFAAFATSF